MTACFLFSDALPLFESEQTFETFMEDNGFTEARIQWHTKRQNHKRAAQLLFETDRILDAVDLLSTATDNPANCLLAWDFGIRFLWDSLSLGSPTYFADRSQAKLALTSLEKLPSDAITDEKRLQVRHPPPQQAEV